MKPPGVTMRILPSLVVLVLVGCPEAEPVPEVNHAPVAEILLGSVAGTGPILLDGRASYDPDGDALVFHWSFDHAPADSGLQAADHGFSANHDADASVTRFVPDVPGTYVVALQVSDGSLYADPAYAVITIDGDEDAVPVAHAGADLTVALGDEAVLDGWQSFDPLGGSLEWDWNLAAVPYESSLTSADLLDADGPRPRFTPDVSGRFSVSLRVENAWGVSAPDTVEVVVPSDGTRPEGCVVEAAVAGEDCTWIELGGEGRPDHTVLWELQERPAGSLATNASFASRTSASTRFFPDVAGAYAMLCSVFDGEQWSLPVSVAVDVAERSHNAAPVANAGVDRTEYAGEADCERGAGSTWSCDECDSFATDVGLEASDADGDPLTISWTVIDGDGTLRDGDQVPATLLVAGVKAKKPDACVEEDIVLELEVEDCPGAVRTDRVTITAECCGVD